jgi:hypothetical protein
VKLQGWKRAAARWRSHGAFVTAVVVVGVAAATAGATIIPFNKAGGVRLGMTMQQAKAALGSCPTLTPRTRRNRSRYKCYFDVFPGERGERDLTYTSRTRRCGASVTLVRGRVRDVDITCPDTLRSGAGIGSPLKDVYASFPAGRMRCIHAGWHKCYTQRVRKAGIWLTIFSDDKTARDLVVSDVFVGKCKIKERAPAAGTPAFRPCAANFLTTQARVPKEFTP